MQYMILHNSLQVEDGKFQVQLNKLTPSDMSFPPRAFQRTRKLRRFTRLKCQADMRPDVMGSPQNRVACLNHDDVTPIPGHCPKPWLHANSQDFIKLAPACYKSPFPLISHALHFSNSRTPNQPPNMTTLHCMYQLFCASMRLTDHLELTRSFPLGSRPSPGEALRYCDGNLLHPHCLPRHPRPRFRRHLPPCPVCQLKGGVHQVQGGCRCRCRMG